MKSSNNVILQEYHAHYNTELGIFALGGCDIALGLFTIQNNQFQNLRGGRILKTSFTPRNSIFLLKNCHKTPNFIITS